jgi:DNA polymerase-4
VRTLPGWTDSTSEIYDTAADLYTALGLDQPRIRLVGVKCENFRTAGETPEQLTLDALADETASGNRRAAGDGSSDRVVDAARAKFGAGAMGYGTLLPTPGRGARGEAPEPS